jgi:hypothetical protein
MKERDPLEDLVGDRFDVLEEGGGKLPPDAADVADLARERTRGKPPLIPYGDNPRADLHE